MTRTKINNLSGAKIYIKVREICDGKRITDYKLAKECGFERASISRWKKNESLPSLETIYSVAKYLEVPIESLL